MRKKEKKQGNIRKSICITRIIMSMLIAFALGFAPKVANAQGNYIQLGFSSGANLGDYHAKSGNSYYATGSVDGSAVQDADGNTWPGYGVVAVAFEPTSDVGATDIESIVKSVKLTYGATPSVSITFASGIDVNSAVNKVGVKSSGLSTNFDIGVGSLGSAVSVTDTDTLTLDTTADIPTSESKVIFKLTFDGFESPAGLPVGTFYVWAAGSGLSSTYKTNNPEMIELDIFPTSDNFNNQSFIKAIFDEPVRINQSPSKADSLNKINAVLVKAVSSDSYSDGKTKTNILDAILGDISASDKKVTMDEVEGNIGKSNCSIAVDLNGNSSYLDVTDGGAFSTSDGGSTGGTVVVNDGGTIAQGETGSISEGATVSDVTNEGTIENKGTVQDCTNKGTIEGGTVAGTVTNTDGTLKDVAIGENAVVQGGNLEGEITIGEGASLENVTVAANATVKGGNLKGEITIGEGASLENVTVAANATVNLSGADIVVNVVTESGSKMVLALGSSMHGVVSSSEGASLNLPEGAIVTITGNSITIQFSKPDIPVSGQAAIAALTVPALPEQYTLVDALTVSPDGATLEKPATVTIPYDKTNIPEGFTKADFKVLALDPATMQWEELPDTSVTEVTDDNVTIDTDLLSTYAVVVSSLYPVISTAAGNVIDPESVSAPIEDALNEMLPDNSISVNPDKTSGILNVNIDGILWPISAIRTGSAESQSKAGFELMDNGLTAQFILSNGTTIQIVPMAADPQGLTDILTASNELTVQFQPDYGMIIVKDASNNRYAGMFGWTAGSIGTKTIEGFNSTGGVINIVYKDGSTQTLAPVLGSIQKFIEDFNNAGFKFNVDRNTGTISLINPSSCWVPDYTMKPLSFADLVNEYLFNMDAYGIYFKINSSQNLEMWTNLGKQLIMQTQCK